MELPLDLQTIWFVLVGVLLTGYAILDGFDLGVGILHLFTRTDHERRIMLNAIGPIWDGNEVWLVTGAGALFAAFREVYATVFSGFYLAFILFLLALIFRAVAIEFRSKQPMRWWRQMWDVLFCLGSLGASLLVGIMVGNIAWGVPLDASGEYAGTLADLFTRPYAWCVAVTTVALFAMHGAIYVVMKTEGEMHDKIRAWINNCIILFIICYATTTMATLLFVPQMTALFKEYPALFGIAVINMLAIANIPREIYHGRDFLAFLSSCVAIAALLCLFGVGMYPNMVYSVPNPENSLTLYNGASSEKTLGLMLIIALCGVPLVLAYTASIYWVFRGKVKLDATSY